jgi:hypothetical protein
MYIFVVISYFILSSTLDNIYTKTIPGYTTDVVEIQNRDTSVVNKKASNPFVQKLKNKIIYMEAHLEEYETKILHTLPKLFFFMPPIFALFLSIFFIRQRGVNFVDHAIFAFHIHTMLFFVLFLNDIFLFNDRLASNVLVLGMLAMFFYTVRAMTTVYSIRWYKALLFSTITIGLDFIVFLTMLIALMLML